MGDRERSALPRWKLLENHLPEVTRTRICTASGRKTVKKLESSENSYRYQFLTSGGAASDCWAPVHGLIELQLRAAPRPAQARRGGVGHPPGPPLSPGHLVQTKCTHSRVMLARALCLASALAFGRALPTASATGASLRPRRQVLGWLYPRLAGKLMFSPPEWARMLGALEAHKDKHHDRLRCNVHHRCRRRPRAGLFCNAQGGRMASTLTRFRTATTLSAPYTRHACIAVYIPWRVLASPGLEYYGITDPGQNRNMSGHWAAMGKSVAWGASLALTQGKKLASAPSIVPQAHARHSQHCFRLLGVLVVQRGGSLCVLPLRRRRHAPRATENSRLWQYGIQGPIPAWQCDLPQCQSSHSAVGRATLNATIQYARGAGLWSRQALRSPRWASRRIR